MAVAGVWKKKEDRNSTYAPAASLSPLFLSFRSHMKNAAVSPIRQPVSIVIISILSINYYLSYGQIFFCYFQENEYSEVTVHRFYKMNGNIIIIFQNRRIGRG